MEKNLSSNPKPYALHQSPVPNSLPFSPPYPLPSTLLSPSPLSPSHYSRVPTRERERRERERIMATLTSIPSTTLSKAISSKPRTAYLASKPRLSISCSSDLQQQQQDPTSALKSFSAALALSSILLSSAATAPPPAAADIAGLTPCKDSKAFAKREKQSLKKLESSLKLYAPDSAPALAIQATMEKTKRRFDNYGKFGLLCGSDGLPHLIVSGDQRHWGEFITPGLLFLYIAGWIGWVGRSYLIAVREDKKPTMKEIIIDVPLASRLLFRGFIWPVAAYRELINGDLIDETV